MLFGGRKRELTFKERVEAFWNWYASSAKRFYETIEGGECAGLAEEVSEKVSLWLCDLAWVFGPGRNGAGHSFTLSPEGNPHRQFLTSYWLSRAPKLEGWTFYSARQPGPIDGSSIQIGGNTFAANEIWVSVQPDFENECVDITVWHPKFSHLGDEAAHTLIFLFLDESLGEHGTGRWIGQIHVHDQALRDAMPLSELAPHVRGLSAVHQWPLIPPDETWISYSVPEPSNRFPRADIIAGISCNRRLVLDYLRGEGEMEDPLEKSGADFVFVSFPSAILPAGREAEHRGALEDIFDEALVNARSGRAIGGGTGTGFAYIDLFIVDGDRSVELIVKTMKKLGLPRGSGVHFFARNQLARRVIL